MGQTLGQESRGPQSPADLDEELGSPCFNPQLGEKDQLRLNLKAAHDVANNRQVQVYKLFPVP